VPALESLVARTDFHIDLVVTQPDRPKGRGKKLGISPVKKAAIRLGLEIFQPQSLKDEASLSTLANLAPDYFVVVAFGQILPPWILAIPKVYPVNIHASLLPRYRGAAPIQAAVLNQDTHTGVTTMVMAAGLDSGDILLQSTTPIHPEETAQDLHDRLAVMGADLIVTTIEQLNQNRLTPVPQDHAKATYVGRLQKSHGRINWDLPAPGVCAHINAMTPWPGAFTWLKGKRVKIFKAIPGEKTITQAPGTLFRCDEKGIHVATGKGGVIIRELMGTSGKRLKADAYLRGHPLDLPVQFEQGPGD
jgi:methionyl-tRNA formyltransferase